MAKSRFLQIVHDYTWLNPHLSLEISWNGERQGIEATDPVWRKWLPSDPTPAQWYDVERFERLAGAYVADDQDQQRKPNSPRIHRRVPRHVGTTKQRAVLDATGTSRMALADLFARRRGRQGIDSQIARGAMKTPRSRSGRRISASSARNISRRGLLPPALTSRPSTTRRTLRDDEGIPAVIEVAFGYCPNGPAELRASSPA